VSRIKTTQYESAYMLGPFIDNRQSQDPEFFVLPLATRHFNGPQKLAVDVSEKMA
jgi:hypothetical protein